VASTLVLIKTRSLLPLLQFSEEEEQNIDDLERRLKLFKLFEDLGIKIGEQYDKRRLYERPFVSREIVFSPDKQVTPSVLSESLYRVLAEVPQQEKLPEKTVDVVVKIEDMMDQLQDRVQSSMRLFFNNAKKTTLMADATIGDIQRPTLVYTVEGNSFSEEVIKVLDKELEANAHVVCKILSEDELANLNGEPRLVIFDGPRKGINFKPIARTMKHAERLFPEWDQTSMFGIQIGNKCSDENRQKNCITQIKKWFFTEIFEENTNETHYPWGRKKTTNTKKKAEKKRRKRQGKHFLS
jgi:hypothetical protein